MYDHHKEDQFNQFTSIENNTDIWDSMKQKLTVKDKQILTQIVTKNGHSKQMQISDKNLKHIKNNVLSQHNRAFEEKSKRIKHTESSQD